VGAEQALKLSGYVLDNFLLRLDGEVEVEQD
jgi:hypothetical protein